MELRSSIMLGKHSTTKLHPSLNVTILWKYCLYILESLEKPWGEQLVMVKTTARIKINVGVKMVRPGTLEEVNKTCCWAWDSQADQITGRTGSGQNSKALLGKLCLTPKYSFLGRMREAFVALSIIKPLHIFTHLTYLTNWMHCSRLNCG